MSPIPDSPLVNKVYPSPNHNERREGKRPSAIILHYTGMEEASSALLWLANPLSEVSSHYFVFEDGRIWQMVPESRRAWHAGRSFWAGERDMNSASIGVEIVNRGHLKTDAPLDVYPEVQIAAVIRLCQDVVARWKIDPARILAHSDIAPARKQDPGEHFPWERLYHEAGLGLWFPSFPAFSADKPVYNAGASGAPIVVLQGLLARLGFESEANGFYDTRTQENVTAFQRHWRPNKIDGQVDAETLTRLIALVKQQS